MTTPSQPDLNPAPVRYTAVAMLLHWVLAVAILTAFSVGLYVEDLPFSPNKLKLINWHKWAGVTILALSLLRLVWRLTHRPPALPARIEQAMPSWQRVAHHGTHHLMYLLFFAVPLLGWAYSSAKGYPIVWFGVLPLPDFKGGGVHTALSDIFYSVEQAELAEVVYLGWREANKHEGPVPGGHVIAIHFAVESSNRD